MGIFSKKGFLENMHVPMNGLQNNVLTTVHIDYENIACDQIDTPTASLLRPYLPHRVTSLRNLCYLPGEV